MSETTRKLRKFGEGCEGHKLIDWYHMYLGMELAADAIEAVEAQVAEAVARVAALEKRGIDAQGGNRSGESPAGKLAPTGSSESGLGTDLGASSAHASPPAPSAVPAPRGFRVGDTITTRFSHGPQKVERIEEERIYYTRPGDAFQTWTVAKDATLVRAADAPEAPAEDAGLVERLAESGWEIGKNRAIPWSEADSFMRDIRRAVMSKAISALTAESRLCAPGEVARLTAERDEAQGASILNANAVRLQKARAEAAEKELAEARAISAATAERVRNEKQIATELRKDLADARDRIASKDRSIEVMLAETRALREALDAERSGVATKLHDAGFNNVENLVGAYRFERAQADALRAKLAAAESDRDAAFSKETALRRDLLAWQDAAMEARGERDEFKRRLAAADREQERLRAELAALKAKPRSRTRPVTAADLDELEREYNKADYKANEEFRAASALGFRRRVDGAK